MKFQNNYLLFFFNFRTLVLMLLGGSIFFCFECTATFSQKLTTIHHYDQAAKFYYDRENYKKSIHYYQQMIKKFSSQSKKYEKELAWAQYEIGFCYLVMNDYRKALSEFKKVLYEYDITSAKILARQQITKIEKNYIKKKQ